MTKIKNLIYQKIFNSLKIINLFKNYLHLIYFNQIEKLKVSLNHNKYNLINNSLKIIIIIVYIKKKHFNIKINFFENYNNLLLNILNLLFFNY